MPPRTREIELSFLRHAHAGDPAKWTGPDAVRPLSRKGREQAERLGAFLAAHDWRPDRIVSSPKVRAAETGRIVADALDLKLEIDDRLASGLGLSVLGELLDDLRADRPMLVGHDPDFSMLLSTLCGAPEMEMRKGALARIDARLPLDPGAGILRWLVPPESLLPVEG